MFNNTETTMAFAGITVDRFGNFRCAECERFVSASEQAVGRLIKHARHCDSQAQAVAPVAPVAQTDELAAKVQAGRRAIREGAVSAVLTDDEIVLAVRRGLISQSDAMNRDF